MDLSPEARRVVARERSKLAGAEVSDPQLRHAIDEAFVTGFHDVVWVSAGLALLSALTAQMVSGRKSVA